MTLEIFNILHYWTVTLHREISTLLQKKRSLNAIQFEKIIAYQAIWRTPTILSYAYLSTIVIIVIFGVISHTPLTILDLSLKYRYIKKHRNKL